MRVDVAQQVRGFCQEHSLLSRKDHVVVGVSGGFDSLCLLHLLKSFSASLDLTLTVAHLNHQLRAGEAQHDEDFVRDVAVRWQLPVIVERQPVAELAAQRKQSIEEMARQVRYDFLYRVALEVRANKLAVGHNADDQVETVLMHFIRGAGLNGLRGMLPLTEIDYLHLVDDTPAPDMPAPKLIRPLLETWRTEIEAYCLAQHLSPRLDLSNTDTTYFRNRLRHELIPYLETYNPNIKQVLGRTAKVVAAEVELLDKQVEQAWQAVVKNLFPGRIVFDLPAWSGLSLALKRATLRRAVQHLCHSLRDISFEHVEQAMEIIDRGETGAKATLPQGLTLTVSYQAFTVAAEEASAGPGDDMPGLAGDRAVQVTVPGTTPLPHTSWQLLAELAPSGAVPRWEAGQIDPWEAYLDADRVGSAPVLRPRRPGDTFQPLGLGGHRKKVNEFMIDEKIPASQRDHVPLLAAGDQILWICGYRLGERACIRPGTKRILHLRFERR